jgi:hypothetical protein
MIHLPQDGGNERYDFGGGSRVRRGWLLAGGMGARAAFHVSSDETAGDPSKRWTKNHFRSDCLATQATSCPEHRFHFGRFITVSIHGL